MTERKTDIEGYGKTLTLGYSTTLNQLNGYNCSSAVATFEIE